MADNLEDGEFWLPPQFLTDDDILIDFTGPSSGSDPDSSSGTGSSDENESLSVLTRKLSRSSIGVCDLHSKGWGLSLSTSPRSTLCGCVGKDGSSLGSPNPPVSPPPVKADDAETLNLLNKAAGEVARVKMRRETAVVSGTGFFDCGSKLQSCPPPPKIINNNSNNINNYPQFYSHPQFPPFSQQLVWGQMKAANGPLGLPPNAWPPLQPHHNHRNAMPPMFVGHPPPMRECVGTGVFLPRGVPSSPSPTPPPETRKKTEANGKKTRNGKGQSQQRKNSRTPSMANQSQSEIQLPQEWTY